VRVELLHKLHEERRYGSLDELAAAIARDAAEARSFLAGHASERRQTTRDRI
jgi:riboflavin kinase/FMN adenylyltransferase